jgi:hypothetical protein
MPLWDMSLLLTHCILVRLNMLDGRGPGKFFFARIIHKVHFREVFQPLFLWERTKEQKRINNPALPA